MTDGEIIEELLAREGGWRDAKARPDGTVDPPTNRGITYPTYVEYCRKHGLGTPSLAEHRQMDPMQARAVYTGMFIVDPGFNRENIPFEPLRVQLIDFGVNSGPERAIRWLQRVLGVQVDGVFGVNTRHALNMWGAVTSDGVMEQHYRLVNDALVAARSYMIDRAEDQGTIRAQDEEGVESRALSFFLAKP